MLFLHFFIFRLFPCSLIARNFTLVFILLSLLFIWILKTFLSGYQDNLFRNPQFYLHHMPLLETDQSESLPSFRYGILQPMRRYHFSEKIMLIMTGWTFIICHVFRTVLPSLQSKDLSGLPDQFHDPVKNSLTLF